MVAVVPITRRKLFQEVRDRLLERIRSASSSPATSFPASGT